MSEILRYQPNGRASVACLPTSLSSPRVLRYRCESVCVSAEGRAGSPFAAMLEQVGGSAFGWAASMAPEQVLSRLKGCAASDSEEKEGEGKESRRAGGGGIHKKGRSIRGSLLVAQGSQRPGGCRARGSGRPPRDGSGCKEAQSTARNWERGVQLANRLRKWEPSSRERRRIVCNTESEK